MSSCFVFIDESGDLGEKGSKYLVLAALMIENPAVLDRFIKKARRHKFQKTLARIPEIKGNNLQDEVIRHFICCLNEIPSVKVCYVVLDKKKNYSSYLKSNNHKLYNYVAGKLAHNISFIGNSVEIRIDKSKGKQILRDDFNEYFKQSLKPEELNKLKLITHSHSHSWAGLQFADLLAWACFQMFEHDNTSFVDLLKVKPEVYYVW